MSAPAGLCHVGREVAQPDAEDRVAKRHRQAFPEQKLPAPCGTGRKTHGRSFGLAGGGLLVGVGKSQIPAAQIRGHQEQCYGDRHYA